MRSPRKDELAAKTTLAPHEVVAIRVEEVRRRRGWTQQQLSDRLSELGYPMHRLTIAKVEKGDKKNVPLADVLALAAALGVSPLHLIVPFDPDVRVMVTKRRLVPPSVARHWMRGYGLIGDEDLAFYFTELPPEEKAAAMERVAQAASDAHASSARIAGGSHRDCA